MYKEKLLNANIKSESAARLQKNLLAYHEFRQTIQHRSQSTNIKKLAVWQTNRLRETHQDLYADARYHDGLDFLIEDLYAPESFYQRDDDIDRIFPKIIKLLPESLIDTVSALVELNHLTQELDHRLADVLFNVLQVENISAQDYVKAYPMSSNQKSRLHQIQLIANIGDDLDKYTRSKFLKYSLKWTRKPAEIAGLQALHSFLLRGFETFNAMSGVKVLLAKIVERETRILKQIFEQKENAFKL